jgi:hypothetical protein
MRNAYNILVGNPEGRDRSEGPGVNGSVILERTLGKEGGKVWIGCIWLRIWASGGIL